MTGILRGKKAIITGASSGLGFEIAKTYLKAGADVMICGRSYESLEKSNEQLSIFVNPGQKFYWRQCDISRPQEVEDLVSETLNLLGGCHILVNNAGVYGPKGESEKVDWASWVDAIQINLMGSVLMCRALIPHFKSQKYGKVIQLSGGGATQPIPLISAYAVSKAAVVRFAESLAEEVREFGIDINSIAPGALNTGMLEEILLAGPEKVGVDFYQKSVKQKETGGAPLDFGSTLALFLASSKSDGITGKLISAVWDKWEDFPSHLEELKRSDAYTLRRITAKDRGYSWGDK